MEQSWLLVFDSFDNLIHMARRINHTPAGKVRVLSQLINRVAFRHSRHQHAEAFNSVPRSCFFGVKPGRAGIQKHGNGGELQNPVGCIGHNAVVLRVSLSNGKRVAPLAIFAPAAILGAWRLPPPGRAQALDSGWCAHVN
jgi:hypothetical protein